MTSRPSASRCLPARAAPLVMVSSRPLITPAARLWAEDVAVRGAIRLCGQHTLLVFRMRILLVARQQPSAVRHRLRGFSFTRTAGG
jgi:hypothetical protein